MTGIVVTAIKPHDRARWAELWRGYLDFYETQLPPEIYDHTWQRLIAAESPIRGLGRAARRRRGTARRYYPLSFPRPCLDDPRGLLSAGSVRR